MDEQLQVEATRADGEIRCNKRKFIKSCQAKPSRFDDINFFMRFYAHTTYIPHNNLVGNASNSKWRIWRRDCLLYFVA